MDRRSLLKLGLAGVSLPMTLVACDDLDLDPLDSGDTATSCNTANSASGDSDTHGHTLTVPAADLASGLGGTYTSTGGDHDHEVTLSGDDMDFLLDNCSVQVTSDSGGHSHTWEISFPMF
ncbi:MAG: hypothetical protein EP330_22400 [Deltaproteobacteria bacterium]|nr:MAG: hypothetical protein EP330_22400 [Deltaproteobacteria bacterium]